MASVWHSQEVDAGSGRTETKWVWPKDLGRSKIFRDVDGASTTEKVKSSTKYAYNIGFNLSGDKNKSSGKLYIDNVKVVSGSKKITSIDFSKKIDYWGWVKGKDITKKKMAIVKF